MIYQVGRWYKLGDWRLKFIKLEGNEFWSSPAITPHDGYVDNDEGYVELNKYKELPELMTDLSEIIPYLPKDHPDIPRMSKEQKQSLIELIKSI